MNYFLYFTITLILLGDKAKKQILDTKKHYLYILIKMLKMFLSPEHYCLTVLQNVGPNRLISKNTELRRIQHHAEQRRTDRLRKQESESQFRRLCDICWNYG